ncbi:FecR family protein [Hymenobacter sp. UYCo722]|uniref:FecR family protein n=1 Tax=Hymenobacter sp. UYCo722 TaxID=3156335 RepID=UPI0033954BEB
MKPSYLADLLKRYLDHDTTEGEAWTVDQWYEARDMPRPDLTPAEQAAARARSWEQIQRRTRPRPQPQVRPRHRTGMSWAAAAVVLLSLGLGAVRQGLFVLPPAGTVAQQAPTADQLLIGLQADGTLTARNLHAHALPLALADGSTVTLQPGAQLRYPARFTGAQRVVQLEGEAFFEVFHDAGHPFRVLTDKLETTVLGTSFGVRAVPGQGAATVRVRTGRVRVQARAGQPTPPQAAVVLRPNQEVTYQPAAPALRPVLVPQPVLLAPQTLTFEEQAVTAVLRSLEASYGVPIRYDGAALAGCTVTLHFGTETLFEKLDLLSRALGARYERTDTAIIFRSTGCQSK